MHDGIKVNLLDTPGYADFVGELRAGLRAADAALFVVSAVDGMDAATAALWEECAAVGMPRAVVITRLDHQRADFDETVAALPAGLRRQRAAALPAAARRRRRVRRRPDRPDHRSGSSTTPAGTRPSVRDPDPEHLPAHRRTPATS